MGFVYGIPILLIGLSLKYAQLDPVPVEVRTEEGKRKEHRVRRLMIQSCPELIRDSIVHTYIDIARGGQPLRGEGHGHPP